MLSLIVVSPSLTPIEASKTGSSVTAMSGEDIRASGFSQLSDVLRTFPGIAVNQSGSRGSLTQPPVGYQTPSPNYPYGAGTDKGSGWKIPSILDRPVGNDQ